MAVVNKYSTAITNDFSSPPVINPSILTGAPLKYVPSVVEIAAGDDNGSTYRMATIPDTAVIKALKLSNDAITGGTAFNVGIYEVGNSDTAGVAVSASLFASALDLSTAAKQTELRFSALNIDTVEKPLYQLLGFTKSSNKNYHIVVTGTTVGTAAGTLAMQTEWSY